MVKVGNFPISGRVKRVRLRSQLVKHPSTRQCSGEIAFVHHHNSEKGAKMGSLRYQKTVYAEGVSLAVWRRPPPQRHDRRLSPSNSSLKLLSALFELSARQTERSARSCNLWTAYIARPRYRRFRWKRISIGEAHEFLMATRQLLPQRFRVSAR